MTYSTSPASLRFQSTLPARGATCLCYERPAITDWISIHAPRTGSDRLFRTKRRRPANFNPRSPHGERHEVYDRAMCDLLISIHAPRTGSDTSALHRRPDPRKFQSTLPARGATLFRALRRAHIDFNPRSPHGERRLSPGMEANNEEISIHAPRTGSDRIITSRITAT